MNIWPLLNMASIQQRTSHSNDRFSAEKSVINRFFLKCILLDILAPVMAPLQIISRQLWPRCMNPFAVILGSIRGYFHRWTWQFTNRIDPDMLQVHILFANHGEMLSQRYQECVLFRNSSECWIKLLVWESYKSELVRDVKDRLETHVFRRSTINTSNYRTF